MVVLDFSLVRPIWESDLTNIAFFYCESYFGDTSLRAYSSNGTFSFFRMFFFPSFWI